MQTMPKIQTSKPKNVNSVLAKTPDGTIQITLTIKASEVEKNRNVALEHLAENLTIPGFRKGKAPRDIAAGHLDQKKLYEHTLEHILPSAYAEAVNYHQVVPSIAPRFELVSVEEGKDWVIRAITCEIPAFELGNYKRIVEGAKKTDIWVPGKDKKTREITREEKEQQVIKTLLEKFDIQIPAILIEEEVNHRLAQLLDQTQRLGLTIDQYLSSTGKALEEVKKEYELQSKDSLKLIILLNKIAEAENIMIDDQEIEAIISASIDSQNGIKDKNIMDNPERKRLVRSILLRRRALDSLVNLV